MTKLKKATRTNRIYWLDQSRAILILAMIYYHFYWDLVHFQIIKETANIQSLSTVFAHIIASGFLFISGFSLIIASKHQHFYIKFWARFYKISLAALIISLLTRTIFPQDFIYFGILHQIAASSLLIACLAPMPFFLDVALSIIIFSITYYTPQMDLTHNMWMYLGLSKNVQPSLDFVPIFPWTAFSLAGSSAAKLYLLQQRFSKSIKEHPVVKSKLVYCLNKYSLPIYLLHQPIMYGLLFIFLNRSIPMTTNKNNFLTSCLTKCAQHNNKNICQTYCECMQTNLTTSVIANSSKFLRRQANLCAAQINQ